MSKSITLVVSSIVFLVIVAASSFLYAWTGKVVGITDGDTIKVLHDHQEVKIRLHGVEIHQRKNKPMVMQPRRLRLNSLPEK